MSSSKRACAIRCANASSNCRGDSAEENMDDEAVLQEIILPPTNETVEKRVDGGEAAGISRLRDDTQSVRLADDASVFRESSGQHSKRNSEVPAILLIAISALALGTALTITLVSLIYHRKRSSAASSQQTDPRSSFYAIENEPRAWDSLSFSQSITDLSNNKVHFQSWESLSDDSYINSLDEAISQKASIIHAASKKNRPLSKTQPTNSRPSVVITEAGGQQNNETSNKE
ncbi:unnamed protein product [Toxocara canis]|uniref:Sortilin-related receptor n=1 Tax=Toxocara canis TaxID=6265 RepID=A0A183UL60_TOXCA|nr:unnamed protein product [Toxocara canis]